jgi:hypothetical protein
LAHSLRKVISYFVLNQTCSVSVVFNAGLFSAYDTVRPPKLTWHGRKTDFCGLLHCQVMRTAPWRGTDWPVATMSIEECGRCSIGTVKFLLSALRQVHVALTERTGVHHSCIHLNVRRKHVPRSLFSSLYVHQWTAYGPR